MNFECKHDMEFFFFGDKITLLALKVSGCFHFGSSCLICFFCFAKQKTESNTKGQDEDFEMLGANMKTNQTWRAKMRTIPNFKGKKCTIASLFQNFVVSYWVLLLTCEFLIVIWHLYLGPNGRGKVVHLLITPMAIWWF